MEIDYNLPLGLNCLNIKQIKTSSGVELIVEAFKTFIQCDDIIAMEEFINHEQFPENEQDRDKVTLVTKSRAYIIRENIEQASQNWGHYKVWKSKQVIKPLFSIN
jgi:hypothetical protein